MGVVGVKGGAGWVDDDGGDDRSCLCVSLFWFKRMLWLQGASSTNKWLQTLTQGDIDLSASMFINTNSVNFKPSRPTMLCTHCWASSNDKKDVCR